MLVVLFVWAYQVEHDNFVVSQSQSNPNKLEVSWTYSDARVHYTELEFKRYFSELDIQAGLGEVVKLETMHGEASLLNTDYIQTSSSLEYPKIPVDSFIAVELRSYISRYNFPKELYLETLPSVLPEPKRFYFLPATVNPEFVDFLPLEVVVREDSLFFQVDVLNRNAISTFFNPKNPVFNLEVYDPSGLVFKDFNFSASFSGELPAGNYRFVVFYTIDSVIITSEEYPMLFVESNNTLVFERVSTRSGWNTLVALEGQDTEEIVYFKVRTDDGTQVRPVTVPARGSSPLSFIDLGQLFFRTGVSGPLELYTLSSNPNRAYGRRVVGRGVLMNASSNNISWLTGFHLDRYNAESQKVTIIPDDTYDLSEYPYDGVWISLTNTSTSSRSFFLRLNFSNNISKRFVSSGETSSLLHIVNEETFVEREGGHAGNQFGWHEFVFPELSFLNVASLEIIPEIPGSGEYYYSAFQVRGSEVVVQPPQNRR